MKKIINSILAFVTLFSVTSCDLDMDPETAIRPEDAYTMEYCEGVRGYVYVDLKALLSGSFYSIPDLYVDVLNVCIQKVIRVSILSTGVCIPLIRM